MHDIFPHKIDADCGLNRDWSTLAWGSNLLLTKRLIRDVLPTPESPNNMILYVLLERLELADELMRNVEIIMILKSIISIVYPFSTRIN